MTKSALLIGGTGQIGLATAARLVRDGWAVTLAHRGIHSPALPTDVAGIRLDRDDTAALLAAARGNDLVLDAVAFDPVHAGQLAGLAGAVGAPGPPGPVRQARSARPPLAIARPPAPLQPHPSCRFPYSAARISSSAQLCGA